MEKVTVVIPVYNGEETIEKAIKTVINQTYKNLEIIIVDDCSEDKSYEICKKYINKDKRISLIRNKSNKGVSYSRNIGIEQATGEYVLFLDADDRFNTDFVEKNLGFAHEYNADIVITGVKKIDKKIETEISTNNVVQYKKLEIENCKKLLLKEEKKDFNSSILGFVTAKLYKKEVIQEVRFPLDIRFREDTLFNYFAFSNANQICVIPYIGYEYVINDKSASMKMFDKYDKEIEEFINYLISDENYEKYINEIYYCGIHMYMNYLKHYVMHNERKKNSKESSYKLIRKTFTNNFWIKIFNNVKTQMISFPYKVLKFCFKIKSALGIILLFKLNQYRRK